MPITTSRGVVVEARLAEHEPVVGLPCEGCEAVFDGLRTEDLHSEAYPPRRR